MFVERVRLLRMKRYSLNKCTCRPCIACIPSNTQATYIIYISNNNPSHQPLSCQIGATQRIFACNTTKTRALYGVFIIIIIIIIVGIIMLAMCVSVCVLPAKCLYLFRPNKTRCPHNSPKLIAHPYFFFRNKNEPSSTLLSIFSLSLYTNILI